MRCGVCIHGFNVVFSYGIYNVYSSSSSPTGTGTPTPTPMPLALPDDDDNSGPDNFKNDVTMFPDPPDAIGTPASFKSAVSVESLSSSVITGRPPLLPPNPPLKPPKPPADVLLNAPNFDVMAAIFGEITACKSSCSELIGTGGSIPAALFLAAFAASN